MEDAATQAKEEHILGAIAETEEKIRHAANNVMMATQLVEMDAAAPANLMHVRYAVTAHGTAWEH